MNESSIMREIVDKHFNDNWVITTFMGLTFDLSFWWEPYKAAKSALKNVIEKKMISSVTSRYEMNFKQCKEALSKILMEGVLNEDYVINHSSSLVTELRNSNTTLRWLFLHRKSSNKKLRDLIYDIASTEKLLQTLFHVAQFEFLLKKIVQSIIDNRKSYWDACLEECISRLKELSDYFSGQKALSRVKKDERLQKWFSDLNDQVETLDLENSIVASRKIINIINALQNVQQFHQIDNNLQITQFISDTSTYLNRMIQILQVKESTLETIACVSDFTYAWQLIQEPEYVLSMQNQIKLNPKICLLLRSTFLKLVSILELPLVRINQCNSQDVVSVAAYYSSELVNYIRHVLEAIPKSVFSNLSTIIAIQTDKLKELPMKLQAIELDKYSQLDLRYDLAKAFNEIAVFTEGILEMNTTFVGIISVDPRDLLEQGIRKELVLQIAQNFHTFLSFKTDRVVEFEENLSKLAATLQAVKRSFEYIQDYLNLYGLKLWQEESSRIIGLNLEMESNQFLRKQIQPWESQYQDEAIPIPEFLPVEKDKDRSSITFLGRLARQLLIHSDYKRMVYVRSNQAWFSSNGTENLGPRIFSLIDQALGAVGLNGVNRLFSFMISRDLSKLSQSYLNEFIAQSNSNLVFMEDFGSDISPCSQIITDIEGGYNGSISRFEKLSFGSTFSELICSIGQMQLLCIHLTNELSFSCKLDSKLYFCALENLDKSLLHDMKAHAKDPERFSCPDTETTPLFSELSKYLESAGLSNPMEKIYFTTDPLPEISTFLCLLCISQLPNLYWVKRVGVTHKSRKELKKDGYVFVVGLITFLKQLHPLHTQEFVAFVAQYIKSLVLFHSKKPVPATEFPRELKDAILFMKEFYIVSQIPRQVMQQYLPVYILESMEL